MYKGKEFAKQIHLIQKNATTERKACLKKTTNKQENKISLTQMSEVKLYMKVVKYLPDNKSYGYIKKKNSINVAYSLVTYFQEIAVRPDKNILGFEQQFTAD